MSRRPSPITAHYNGVGQSEPLPKKARQNLPTFPVREFNNLLKRTLLEQACENLPPTGARIMDVCCGRGGDILKYEALSPSHVIFLDISPESVREAQRRYAEGVRRGSVTYEASFHIVDCTSANFPFLATTLDPVDIAVCHFALHYAFSSQSSLINLLGAVSVTLREGGVFLATYPNATAIKMRAKNETTGRWGSFGNRYYTVDVPGDLNDEAASTFGAQYTFTLEDAVTQCPEFMVPARLLEYYLRAAQLLPRMSCGFAEAAVRFGIFNSMPRDPELFEVSSLYAATVAVKSHEPPRPPPHHNDHVGWVADMCAARGYAPPVYADWPINDYRQWKASAKVRVAGVTYTEVSAPQSTVTQAQHDAARKMRLRLGMDEHQRPQIDEGARVVECDALTIIPSLHRSAITLNTADLVVHADAPFVDASTAAKNPAVFFIVYRPYNAPDDDPAHAEPNLEVRRAPCRLPGIVFSMMLVAAARLPPTTRQAFATTAPFVEHAEMLIPNATVVTTPQQLEDVFCE